MVFPYPFHGEMIYRHSYSVGSHVRGYKALVPDAALTPDCPSWKEILGKWLQEQASCALHILCPHTASNCQVTFLTFCL